MLGFSNYQPNSYPYISPQQVPQMRQPQPIGRWLMAKDYTEVQNTPIPADGTQTMFMLENEPVFYVVAMMNGQKMVQGYCFTSLNTEPVAQPQKKVLTVEDRLTNLEKMMSQLAVLLEGDNHEPDIPDVKAKATKAAKQQQS